MMRYEFIIANLDSEEQNRLLCGDYWKIEGTIQGE